VDIMGQLIYGRTATPIEMGDRLLTHVQLAIITKLRRNEQFMLSWDHGAEQGNGRSSIWIHPSVPMHFIFSGNKRPTMNRSWVEEILASTNRVGGMHVVPGPPERQP
jgi:hypothetical protein